jgi:hypothetical protein
VSVHVSDHAVLRFLERVHGLDIEAVRAEIAWRAERGAAAASTIGAVEYRIVWPGYTLVVRGERVVTVIPGDPPRPPRPRLFGRGPRRAARLAMEEG